MYNCTNNLDFLRITAWNSRCLASSKDYITYLLETNDIIILNEHHLRKEENFKLKEVCHTKSFHSIIRNCNSRYKTNNYSPGYGGTAIAWSSKLNYKIIPDEEFSNEWICIVKLLDGDGNVILTILGAYLPHKNCVRENFTNVINNISSYIEIHKCNNYIILGDLNSHIGEGYKGGNRSWGRTCTNGRNLLRFVKDYDITICDLLDMSKGPTYTYQSSCGYISYIDHCLISNSLLKYLQQCEVIDEHVLNNSDHLPIYCSY